MKCLTRKAFLASVLGAAVLMGCGGGNSASDQAPTADAATTVPAVGVVKYMADLQATTTDSAEPRDISLVDLAVDETAEPGAV